VGAVAAAPRLTHRRLVKGGAHGFLQVEIQMWSVTMFDVEVSQVTF